MAAPRRHRRHHRHSGRRHHRRRRNPSLRAFASGGMLQTVGGAAVGFFGSNALPALIPQLAQYNTGITGYVLQGVSGGIIAWGLRRFVDARWGNGALIGTGLAILLRMIRDHGAATGSVASAAMSGDLAYYVDDRFPYAQGAGGPYGLFPGNPSLLNPPFPATSAAAVRAGAAAASAAVPAHALSGTGAGRWGVTPQTFDTPTRWM